MNPLKKHTVKHLLKKLGTSPHFSICTVASLCEALEIPRYRQESIFRDLRALHCEKYEDMDTELFTALCEGIQELLKLNPSDLQVNRETLCLT